MVIKFTPGSQRVPAESSETEGERNLQSNKGGGCPTCEKNCWVIVRKMEGPLKKTGTN